MAKRKILVVALLVFTMLASMISFTSAAGSIKVTLDGKSLSLDNGAVYEGGHAFVPFAEVASEIGGTSSTNSKTKSVTVKTVDKTVSVYEGSKTAVSNGTQVKLDAAAKRVSGQIFVPISFLKTIYGMDASYSNSTITLKYFTKMSGTIKIGGSTTVQPISQAAADNLMAMNKGLAISVAGGGSGAGVKGAMSGEFNIGNASREISPSEKVTYKDINDIKIGNDGIAVILNKNNPVKNLTKKQVYEIFTGKIRNWKDVGGKNAPIFLQTREPGSGTLGAFVELAIHPINSSIKDVASSATPNASNGLMREAVAKNANSIGFLSMGFLDSSVKAPTVENVTATLANAFSKKWPYVRPLNILTKGRPTGLTAMYINYLLSPAGQELVAKESYLPLRSAD